MKTSIKEKKITHKAINIRIVKSNLGLNSRSKKGTVVGGGGQGVVQRQRQKECYKHNGCQPCPAYLLRMEHGALCRLVSALPLRHTATP